MRTARPKRSLVNSPKYVGNALVTGRRLRNEMNGSFAFHPMAVPESKLSDDSFNSDAGFLIS